jgi:hypothetical protein
MIDQIEQVLSWLDKLQGLPSAGLIFVLCLAIGYAWRGLTLKWFPNQAIPMVVMLTGALSMMLVADGRPTTMPHHVWAVRNLAVGFIIGAVAWLVHNYALSKLETWLASKYPGLNDTAFFTKNDVTDTTKQDPKP